LVRLLVSVTQAIPNQTIEVLIHRPQLSFDRFIATQNVSDLCRRQTLPLQSVHSNQTAFISGNRSQIVWIERTYARLECFASQSLPAETIAHNEFLFGRAQIRHRYFFKQTQHVDGVLPFGGVGDGVIDANSHIRLAVEPQGLEFCDDPGVFGAQSLERGLEILCRILG
jgi:hypothetical protein